MYRKNSRPPFLLCGSAISRGPQEAAAALVIKDMVTEVKVLLSFVTLVAKVLQAEHTPHLAVILSIPSQVMELFVLTQQTIKLIDTHQKV